MEQDRRFGKGDNKKYCSPSVLREAPTGSSSLACAIAIAYILSYKWAAASEHGLWPITLVIRKRLRI